jgi:hypothetical protein
MLDSHPELAIPRETDFVRPLWWRRVEFGDLSERADRRQVARWIFRDPACEAGRLRRRPGERLTRKQAIRRVTRRSAPTVGSIVEQCFRLYANGHGKPRWGDKRPAYSGFIGPLFAMFPDAQYVNLVRDPRGAVASQAQMGWDAEDVAVPAAIARWEAAIERTDHFARDLRPDQLLDLRYEDMVSDPAAELRRICAFAGLAGGDGAIEAMLAADRRHAYKGIHERLGQPVTTASIERWRERLEPEDVALVEHATASYLDRFGYRPADDVTATPSREGLRELRRQRRTTRREWRASRRGELVRRLRYRRPVAAPGHDGAA